MMTDVVNLTLVTTEFLLGRIHASNDKDSHCQMKIIDFQQEGNVRADSEEKFRICFFSSFLFWFDILLIQ